MSAPTTAIRSLLARREREQTRRVGDEYGRAVVERFRERQATPDRFAEVRREDRQAKAKAAAEAEVAEAEARREQWARAQAARNEEVRPWREFFAEVKRRSEDTAPEMQCLKAMDLDGAVAAWTQREGAKQLLQLLTAYLRQTYPYARYFGEEWK